MSKTPTPIIVGASQFTQGKDTTKPLEPLDLIMKTSNWALEETGSTEIKENIDTLYVLYVFSWVYKDLHELVAEKLGINPKNRHYCPVSGCMPQKLVNRAAIEIARGNSQVILMTGGEAQYTVQKARKSKVTLNWSKQGRRNRGNVNEIKTISDFEKNYQLIIPVVPYAMIETAVRASTKRTVKEHEYHIGNLFEHFSKVASRNPYAWTREPLSAKEITTPTLKNRYICYPYTKRMVANMMVDQSASVVMTSEKFAEQLGIDEKLWVYPMGGADINNIYNLTQRPFFHDSPAIKEATRLALEQSGLDMEDIDVFDIYSCFPSMVEIAIQELGIETDDPRDLTLTGGLPYFGGPYSNYSMHAIATAVERIREDRSLKVMVHANGIFNTSESIGIYGSEPAAQPWGTRDDTKVQDAIYSKQLPEPVEMANGKLIIEAYTFVYDRNGLPTRGVAIGTLENGKRTIAEIEGTPEMLSKYSEIDWVGNVRDVSYNKEKKMNIISLLSEKK